MDVKNAGVKKVNPEEILNQTFPGRKKYKLTKPVKVADKEISEIDVDFESLTSENMEYISGLPGCNSGDANLNEFSKTYLLNVVALAAKLNIHEVRAFSIVDGTALTMWAQSFLMKAVSKTIEES
jgi:plasmid maintenance system antidote protein VapI